MGDNAADGDAPDARRPVNEEYEKLPTDEAELTRMALELRAEVRRLQIELDVRSAALDIKEPGRRPEPVDEQGEDPAGGLAAGEIQAEGAACGGGHGQE